MKLIFLLLSFASLCLCSNAYSQDCVEGINKLPMYGHIKKCKQQLAEDEKFLTYCDGFGSRKYVSEHMATRGWEYFYKNILDTAMMRFNQAWLLDSLNAKAYWGFASILGKQKKFSESIPLFKRALQLNPNEADVWYDESISYGNIFMAKHNIKDLNSVIADLKHAIILNPQKADYYGELANAYGYYTQKDSVRKYVHLANKMGAKTVNPQVQRIFGN